MRHRVPEHAARYEGRVAFHDCDPLGIVWHGNYYRYLELGRTELMRKCRLDVQDFVSLGHGLLVIETRCRHAFPLRYGEDFAVRAFMIDYEQRIHVGYEVMNLTHRRRAARGLTTLVTTDAAGNMLLETPAVVQQRIRDGIQGS